MTRTVYWAALVCILAQMSLVNFSCFAGAAKDNKAARDSRDGVLRFDEVYPVYGPRGSRRQTPFVAGEDMHFAAKISGIARRTNGDCDVIYTYRLLYPSGKVVEGQCAGWDIHRESLPLGGGTSLVFFSFLTPMSAPSGRYKVEIDAGDAVGEQRTETEIAVDVLDKRTFCILNDGLYYDREGQYALGGNVTIGESGYVKLNVRVPKDKNNEANVTVTVTVLDHSGKAIWESDQVRLSDKNIEGGGTQFFAVASFRVPEMGYYRIHVEAKNLSTGVVDRHDLPLAVHLPPSHSTLANVVAGSKPQERLATPLREGHATGSRNTLSISAYPTVGELGSPRDATFVVSEQLFFNAVLSGLSCGANHQADCVVEVLLSEAGSSTGPHERKTVVKMPLQPLRVSPNHSCIIPVGQGVWCRPGPYRATFIVRDNVAGANSSNDMDVRFVDMDRFDLGGLCLSSDEDGKLFTGCNLTVGDKVFAKCEMFLPKKSSGHDLEVTASFLDEDHKELTRLRPRLQKNVTSVASFRYGVIMPYCTQEFTCNRSGSYFVSLEVKDLTTKESIAKEIPFDVFLPPEMAPTGHRGVQASHGKIDKRPFAPTTSNDAAPHKLSVR